MSNSDDLSSYIVVESVHRAGVDEAVSYPESSLHNLLDLPLDLDIKNKDTKVINVRCSFKVKKTLLQSKYKAS